MGVILGMRIPPVTLWATMVIVLIVVTLVCVVLGSVMGRVEYLRRWAAYHQRVGNRFDDNAMRDFKRNAESLVTGSPGFNPRDSRAGYYHSEMAKAYRQAVYLPWMPFSEPRDCTELRKNHPELGELPP